MTNKVYRSAMGRVVDMGALRLKNESVRAVGNMQVNARGDIVDASNQPVKPRNKVVAAKYSQQTRSNVRDEEVQISSSASQKTESPQESAIKKAKSEAPPTGLAAAIARAKQNQDIDDEDI